jgi:plasmid stability protein
MPTLYVENVPEDLYEALRKRAKAKRSSMAAEVIAVLEVNIPTAKEQRRRQKAIRELIQLGEQSQRPAGAPSSLELLREDRNR